MTTAAIIFFVVNAIVAVCYGLLAIFFAKRVRLPAKKMAGWRTILALIFAALFFIGCAHTHIELAILAYHGLLHAHWLGWPTVLSHVLQSIGGLGFLVLASRWVELSIYDKHDFDSEIYDAEQEILLDEQTENT
jgi:hypothetical protein